MLTTILPMLKMGHLYEPPLMSALRRKYKLDEHSSISHLKKKKNDRTGEMAQPLGAGLTTKKYKRKSNNNKKLYSTRDEPQELCLPGKFSTTELYLQPWVALLCCV